MAYASSPFNQDIGKILSDLQLDSNTVEADYNDTIGIDQKLSLYSLTYLRTDQANSTVIGNVSIYSVYSRMLLLPVTKI